MDERSKFFRVREPCWRGKRSREQSLRAPWTSLQGASITQGKYGWRSGPQARGYAWWTVDKVRNRYNSDGSPQWSHLKWVRRHVHFRTRQGGIQFVCSCIAQGILAKRRSQWHIYSYFHGMYCRAGYEHAQEAFLSSQSPEICINYLVRQFILLTHRLLVIGRVDLP